MLNLFIWESDIHVNILTTGLQRNVLRKDMLNLFTWKFSTHVNSVITRQQKKCSLKRHVESIHMGIRHSCEECDYTTPKKW